MSKREAIYKNQGIRVPNWTEDIPLCSWNIQKQLVYYAVENNTFLQRTVNDLVLNIHVQAWTDSLEVEDRTAFRQSAHEGGKVLSPTLIYPPGDTLVVISVSG